MNVPQRLLEIDCFFFFFILIDSTFATTGIFSIPPTQNNARVCVSVFIRYSMLINRK